MLEPNMLESAPFELIEDIINVNRLLTQNSGHPPWYFYRGTLITNQETK